jgi:hypothetical protein
VISAIVSLLVFIVPVVIFVLVQLANARNRTRSHWPQPPKQAENQPVRIRRKARARPPASAALSCGRPGTHLLLTLVGARDSCSACARLRATSQAAEATAEPADVLAEAERILNEARDQSSS